jgi:pyruvate dehydrogenase E1 component alpha subunit
MDDAVAKEMDGAIDFAMAAAEPALDTMFRDVFAPGEPEPEPLRVRIDRVLAEG